MLARLETELSAEAIGELPYKTPYFLISGRALLRRLAEFRRCFPGAAIHYAVKANSEERVIQILAAEGCGFEAASRYELDYLRQAGVPPDRIIYGTSVKPVSHIEAFAAYGVDRFALDSRSELEKIAKAAPGARVYGRIRVNDAGSVFKFSEKFGTDKVNAADLLLRGRELGLKPYGLSFHVGSQARNRAAWRSALGDVADVMRTLTGHGIKIEALNIGGGFPCEYASSEQVPGLDEIAQSVSEGRARLPYQPEIIIEPGRGIVAEAAVVVASVIGRIERGDKTWLFLDAGVYNAVFETMAYQGSTRYPVESLRFSNETGEALFALAGPTGDAPDVITREALLPRDMNVGDKLIIRNAGAYSLSVTSRFNGFPAPAVYFA